ncbi:MAG: nucleotide exchange factor GrpE [Bacteroidota bacterium]
MAEKEQLDTVEQAEEIKHTTESTATAEETLTPEEQLEIDNHDLKLQVEELKDKYIRLRAEFDNFRKRSIREKSDYLKTASRDTLSALLPVLDDFGRAEQNMEGGIPEGVQIVYNKMLGVLEQKGLKAMISTGEDFNADLHEAVTELPVTDEAMKGKVVDTIETGYYLNDKIIRHAKVVVGK